MNLTIEDLKTIRCALNRHPLSRATSQAVMGVDAELAKHNLKFEMVPKPKRKWQRDTEFEYVFKPISMEYRYTEKDIKIKQWNEEQHEHNMLTSPSYREWWEQNKERILEEDKLNHDMQFKSAYHKQGDY